MSGHGRLAFLRVALVVSSVLALAGCDWVMYRSNAAHTGHVPVENAIDVSNVATLQETSAIAGHSPVVADGRLYVLEAGFLKAYAADGSELRWQASIMNGGRTPAVVGGTVFVSAFFAFENENMGKLYAFDAAGIQNCSGTPATCEPLWTANISASFVSPPTVADGVVFVNGVTELANRMVAFDAAGEQGCSGTPKVCAPLWNANTGPPAQWLADDIRQRSPAVANGLVFVSGADNNVHVYDAAGETGCGGTPKACSELWTANTDLPCDESFSGCGISAPVAANNVLHVMGRDFDNGGGLFAFDAQGVTSCSGSPKTCAPLWTGPGVSNFSPPAIANGIAYTVGDVAFTPESNRLRAFDAAGATGCSGTPKTCAPLWTSSTELHGPAPAVANGVVYATSNQLDCDDVCLVTRKVLAFDATGSTGCTGTPKFCDPLLDIESTAVELEFDDPVLANGVLYISDTSVHVLTLP